MSTLPAQIYIALRNRLQTMPSAPVIVEPGDTYPTSPDTPFILIQDERIDIPRKYATTDAPDDFRGIFALAVMTPLEWSHAQGMGIAGQIVERFKKGTVLQPNIRMEKTPQPVRGAYRDGAFNRLPVNCYWKCVG